MYKNITLSVLLLLTQGVVMATGSEPPKKSIYEAIRKQGERVYAAGDYRHALLLYKRYYARYSDQPTAMILADCYWQIGYYDSAMAYLQRCDMNSTLVRERMAEIKARKGAYAEAAAQYDALMSSGDQNRRPWYQMRREGFTNTASMYRDSMDWKLDYLSLNTSAHETSPMVYKGYLYVVSNRMNGSMLPTGSTLRPGSFHYMQKAGALDALGTRAIRRVQEVPFDYTRKYLPDLTVRASNDSRTLMPGIAKKKLPFTGTVINPLFERAPLSEAVGPVSFSADGKKVYYSRIKNNKENDGASLELCSADRKGNNWGNVQVLTLNDTTGSSFHPHLSADGRTLYFSSDRAGGKGGADLYRAALQEDGSWSQVENIAAANSAGDEVNPSTHEGRLYFASTGLPGLGGADLFSMAEKGSSKPENMGYPVNSAADDYSMVFAGKGAGFVSTNRYGSDDVLRFAYEKKYVTVSRTLINSATGMRQSNIEVVLEQQQENGSWAEVEKQTTDHRGIYSFKVRPNQSNYRVRLRSTEFTEQVLDLDTRGITSWREDEVIKLQPITGANNSTSNNTNSTITNNNASTNNNANTTAGSTMSEVAAGAYRLYHLFDRTTLEPESEQVLTEIKSKLEANANLQIEIVSAADCIGSDAYNMALSQRRAKHVVALLPRSLRSRVRTRWVGASSPAAPCDDASTLTPATQRVNRYTSIRIVE